MLTLALNEVFSSLVPLRYKWSESVLETNYALHPFVNKHCKMKGFLYN